MDKILEQVRAIHGQYRLAVNIGIKIEELQKKIEVLLEENKGDIKGYDNALKKLKDKSSKGKKAEMLISEIKKMQKISIISHYESKKEVKNTTKEEK